MVELRYRNLTYQLRGWIFQIRRELKAGWSEEEYHQALAQLLRQRRVPVESKLRKTISHREIPVHTFECDLLVWDLIVLELKALQTLEFSPANMAQLISYLKCWQKDLGLLVNFGPQPPKIQRVIWDEAVLKIDENYDSIKSRMAQSDKEILRQVRQSILSLGHQYGLGYPDTMYRQIVEIELLHMGIVCQANAEIPVDWNGQKLGTHNSNHLLVENRYLVNIRSLLDYPPKHDYARMKTYLNALGLEFGLIVNFGKKQLQIYGVNNY